LVTMGLVQRLSGLTKTMGSFPSMSSSSSQRRVVSSGGENHARREVLGG
jgi:hypothetical protein